MKLYYFITLLIISTISGCSQPKFVRKEMETKGVKVVWFYYNNISNSSPDIIEVLQGSESKIIFKGVDVITNFSVLKDTIIINLYKPERGIVIEDNTNEKVFDFYVRLDSTATLDDYRKIPDGKRE